VLLNLPSVPSVVLPFEPGPKKAGLSYVYTCVYKGLRQYARISFMLRVALLALVHTACQSERIDDHKNGFVTVCAKRE